MLICSRVRPLGCGASPHESSVLRWLLMPLVAAVLLLLLLLRAVSEGRWGGLGPETGFALAFVATVTIAVSLLKFRRVSSTWHRFDSTSLLSFSRAVAKGVELSKFGGLKITLRIGLTKVGQTIGVWRVAKSDTNSVAAGCLQRKVGKAKQFKVM